MSSFADLDKKTLLEIAENFGVEVDSRLSAKNIIPELLDSGVTWEMYQQSLATEQEENETRPDPEPVAPPVAEKKFKTKATEYLVKMERQNPTFEVRGYRFTRQHPFAAVAEHDVNFIMANYEGFRIATPSEVQEYYNK